MDQARSGALKCKVMQNLSGSEHPHKTGSHIPASVTSGSKVGLGDWGVYKPRATRSKPVRGILLGSYHKPPFHSS